MVKNLARSKESRRRTPQYLSIPGGGGRPIRDGYLSDSSLFNHDVRKSSFSYQLPSQSRSSNQIEPLKRNVYGRRSLKQKVSNSAQQAYSEIRKITNKIHTKTHTNCKRRYKKISALVRWISWPILAGTFINLFSHHIGDDVTPSMYFINVCCLTAWECKK